MVTSIYFLVVVQYDQEYFRLYIQYIYSYMMTCFTLLYQFISYSESYISKNCWENIKYPLVEQWKKVDTVIIKTNKVINDIIFIQCIDAPIFSKISWIVYFTLYTDSKDCPSILVHTVFQLLLIRTSSFYANETVY